MQGSAGGGEGWQSSYAHREDSRWHDRVGERAAQWAVSPVQPDTQLASPSRGLPPPPSPLRPQVCECLILFMERNEEEFAKFLQTFTQDVWTQLMRVSQAPGQVRAGGC